MRRLASWLGWAAVSFVVWLGLTATVDPLELLAGACAAAIAAAGAEALRSQGLLRYRIEPAFAARIRRPLGRVVPDFGLVLLALVRRAEGSLEEVPFRDRLRAPRLGGGRGLDRAEQRRRRDRRQGEDDARAQARRGPGAEVSVVNAWLIASTALLVGLLPCLVVIARAPHVDALVALELAGVLATLALVCLAEGFVRSSYYGLPLALAPLTFVGSLIFVRALDRWL